jgi:hypothetical protein
MTFATNLTQRSRMIFAIAVVVGLAFVLLKAGAQSSTVFARLASGDHDDIMRLMQVRAWLDGQSWFDTTQYRVLPPDGISLHWSRYVDLGIAAILVPLSKVMPMAVAEQWTLVIWPTLLMSVMIVIVARGTDRILGPVAACGAVGSLVTWLPTGNLYFEAGKLDHHNVQILATTVLAFAMVWPGDPVRRGIAAGIAAAFSLAVGLETLPLVGVAGIVLLLRGTFDHDGAVRLLVAFCCALMVGLGVFFIGQTAPGAWGTPACDKLSPPVLALGGVASAASLGPMLARRWLAHPMARLLATVLIAGVGLWLCAPLLSPCLAGPYGALPLDLQIVINRDITEAQPGYLYAQNAPFSFHSYVTPAIAAVGISAVLWYRRRLRAATPALENAAVAQMLVLACVGVIGTWFQIRIIILAAPAVPFLTGYALRCLWQNRVAHRTAKSSLVLVVGVILTLFADRLNGPALSAVTAIRGEAATARLIPQSRDTCRDPAVMAQLNDLPKATILTAMNLASSMILTTHHDAITAPYHRSAAAFWNATYPMNSLGDMRTALQTSGATYVVLCRATFYGAKRLAAHALIAGETPAWLRRVAFDGDAFLVFAVIPDALGP